MTDSEMLAEALRNMLESYKLNVLNRTPSFTFPHGERLVKRAEKALATYDAREVLVNCKSCVYGHDGWARCSEHKHVGL